LADLKELKEEYLMMASEIASIYGLKHEGKLRTITVMKLLCEYECENFIIHSLRNPDSSDDEKFDRYYGEKHEFCKRKLVERLKNKLEEMGKRVLISTETEADTGHYDIVIVSGQQIRIMDKTGKVKIVIEVKASLGIDLSRIERYLWDAMTLVIVRIVTGHVKKIKTEECLGFLSESLQDLIKKAKRILANKPILVAGFDCRICRDVDCKYNKNCKANSFHWVVMKNEEFNLDFDRLFINMYPTITRVVDMVIEEFESDAKAEKDLYSGGNETIRTASNQIPKRVCNELRA